MRKSTVQAISTAMEYLVAPGKSLVAAAGLGAGLLVTPDAIHAVTEYRPELVIVLGALAGLDAIGYFTRPRPEHRDCDPCDLCQAQLNDVYAMDSEFPSPGAPTCFGPADVYDKIYLNNPPVEAATSTKENEL
ncbi:hypothetical protein KV557_24740 [Kitasatospora aureofaciens]|uniref:hypothetical protein n=1 Tax=Kitasatospora aureofaciens TaxID=1894 RepID=UPI001C43B9D1|nr:hypothetical protein [Kitasatospora aureofaciens]MBV6700273.1 hypothetical protein [Kitasatospora aureofaciens]